MFSRPICDGSEIRSCADVPSLSWTSTSGPPNPCSEGRVGEGLWGEGNRGRQNSWLLFWRCKEKNMYFAPEHLWGRRWGIEEVENMWISKGVYKTPSMNLQNRSISSCFILTVSYDEETLLLVHQKVWWTYIITKWRLLAPRLLLCPGKQVTHVASSYSSVTAISLIYSFAGFPHATI